MDSKERNIQNRLKSTAANIMFCILLSLSSPSFVQAQDTVLSSNINFASQNIDADFSEMPSPEVLTGIFGKESSYFADYIKGAFNELLIVPKDEQDSVNLTILASGMDSNSIRIGKEIFPEGSYFGNESLGTFARSVNNQLIIAANIPYSINGSDLPFNIVFIFKGKSFDDLQLKTSVQMNTVSFEGHFFSIPGYAGELGGVYKTEDGRYLIFDLSGFRRKDNNSVVPQYYELPQESDINSTQAFLGKYSEYLVHNPSERVVYGTENGQWTVIFNNTDDVRVSRDGTTIGIIGQEDKESKKVILFPVNAFGIDYDNLVKLNTDRIEPVYLAGVVKRPAVDNNGRSYIQAGIIGLGINSEDETVVFAAWEDTEEIVSFQIDYLPEDIDKNSIIANIDQNNFIFISFVTLDGKRIVYRQNPSAEAFFNSHIFLPQVSRGKP